MSEYKEMWREMGIDLEAHDSLLRVLGSAYKDIYLRQQNRPKGMEYFDFVVRELHGFRVKELMEAREQGRKVIGTFCVFVPEELVIAVNAIAVGLCAGADIASDAAEQYVPRNTCSLIKSAFGFKLAKVCPYIEATDLIVGENTCDGKKKAFEQYKDVVDDLYVMDLPQMKSEVGRHLLKAEYKRFARKLEEITGNKITTESLNRGIKIVNAKRKAINRLDSLRAASLLPISGLDSLLTNQVFFYDDPERFTASVNAICDELEERIANKEGVCPENTPRIIVSGCPMAVPNWKLPHVIETSGAIIVGEEMCTGVRGTRNNVNEDASTLEEMFDSITDRYFKIDCAVFTPNTDRLNHVKEMVKEYKADGVIHYGLQFCQPYAHEAMNMERLLEAEDIPVLSVETDYSQEDLGQLKTRVEAFVERLQD